MSVAAHAVQSFNPLSAAVLRRVPADKVVKIFARPEQVMHLSRADSLGIFAEERSAVGMISYEKI